MLEVDVLGLGDHAVPYREAWEKQREVHHQVVYFWNISLFTQLENEQKILNVQLMELKSSM